MTDQPQPAQELLDVAARLAGVQTVDLLKVRQEPDGSLIVILCTGQKFTFSPDDLVAQLGADLQSYLQGLVQPPAAKAKGKK